MIFISCFIINGSVALHKPALRLTRNLLYPPLTHRNYYSNFGLVGCAFLNPATQEMPPNMWDVDEEALNKQIFKDFNKTKEDLNEDINTMRKWVKTQPHFPEEPDYNVLRFVVLFNKFSIEKAKQKLDMYYTIRTMMSEFYKSLPLSPELILQSRVVYKVPLPKPTSDFKRIIYARVNPDFGPESVVPEHVVENFCNLLELIILEDKCYSFHYIFDCAGIRLAHLGKISPMVFRNVLFILEKVYSNRLVSMYIVNFAKFMEPVMDSIIKPMISPKLRSRMQIHSNTDLLLEVFGKSTMPKDIGGEERSLDELNDEILKKFEANKNRFEVLRGLRIDESLRPKKLVNDEILGYYGNFKKLEVD